MRHSTQKCCTCTMQLINYLMDRVFAARGPRATPNAAESESKRKKINDSVKRLSGNQVIPAETRPGRGRRSVEPSAVPTGVPYASRCPFKPSSRVGIDWSAASRSFAAPIYLDARDAATCTDYGRGCA
jgi:hypothetical protein